MRLWVGWSLSADFWDIFAKSRGRWGRLSLGMGFLKSFHILPQLVRPFEGLAGSVKMSTPRQRLGRELNRVGHGAFEDGTQSAAGQGEAPFVESWLC